MSTGDGLQAITEEENDSYVSPGAQKHLFHISNTKGLRLGIFVSMTGDPKKAILKFCNFAQQPRGASKYTLNVTFNSQFEYIHET